MINFHNCCLLIFGLSNVVLSQRIVFPNNRPNCGPSYECMRMQACRTDESLNDLQRCSRYRVCCPVSDRPRPGPQPNPSYPRPNPSNPRPNPSNPRPNPSNPRPNPPNPRPNPSNPRPNLSNPRPGPSNPQPAPSNPRPAPSNPRPPRPLPTEPTPPSRTAALTNECGVSRNTNTFRGLVMGGTNVTQGTYPWMAALLKRRRRSEDIECTAFMIDRRHALSAAHCFRPNDPTRYALNIGDVEWRRGTRYEIERIDIPEGYRNRRFYDDIAVITLRRSITDPNFVPVCLPTEEIGRIDLTQYGVTVVGWGSERFGGEMTERLMQLTGIPVVSNEECDRRLSTQISDFRLQFERGISDQMVCAGFMTGGRDSCGGDSGGPLMYFERSSAMWYAIGIVSFGFECGQPGYPAGYTRISSYMDYIRRNTS